MKHTDDHRPCEYNPCLAIDSTKCALLKPEVRHRRTTVQDALDRGCRVARFQIKEGAK